MASLRPRGADDLGLRRALSDRLLPLLVAAMAFLAALAGGGSIAAAGLARHWRGGIIPAVTIQVPQPGDAVAGEPGSRADAVAAVLGTAGRRLPEADVADLLRPWLGDDLQHLSVALPAVFVVQGALTPGTEARLATAAPGTLVAHGGAWQDRLAALAASLQACAGLALGLVAFVAAAVVAVATRAGLAARREAIAIVHGLGATDGMIAARFSARITLLAGAGACLGAILAAPVLLGLARLAAPFAPGPSLAPTATPGQVLASLPPLLWWLLAALPPLAAAIGWVTAQATVRSWLGQLP